MSRPAPARFPARFLRFLPVVERELRLAARGLAAYRWRAAVAATGLALMAVLTIALTADRSRPEALGKAMFFGLVTVSALYACLAGVLVTADTLSREKREGTLGLLFLTDLRGLDVVLGKLVASSLNTVYGLLGLLPLLAVPVMLGGVGIQAGVLAALAVLNLLFVSLCLGLAVSAISRDERRAAFAALLAVLFCGLGPFLLLELLHPGPAGTLLVVGSSPFFPVVASVMVASQVMIPPAAYPFGAATLPLMFVPSHLLGWGLLLAASRLAGSTWLSRRNTSVRRTVDEQVFTPRDPATRTAARRRLLDLHPLVWLLERHPGKRFYADGLVVAILVIWYFGYLSYGTEMFGGPSWFLITPLAVVVHLVFTAWVVAESSMRWIQDRRSGALELLLCTALTDRDLVSGYQITLRRLFARPVIVMVLAEIFVALYGFGDSDESTSASGRWLMLSFAAVIALDTAALSWIALRLATSLPTVNRVGALALTITPLGPLVLASVSVFTWNLLHGAESRLEFPASLVVWLGWVLVIDLGLGLGVCRRWAARGLRQAAVRIQPKAAVAAQ